MAAAFGRIRHIYGLSTHLATNLPAGGTGPATLPETATLFSQ